MRSFVKGMGDVFVLALAVSAPISESCAQSQSPGAFYEKGFAGAPRVGGGEIPGPERYTPRPNSAISTPEAAKESVKREVSGVKREPHAQGSEQTHYRMLVKLYVASHDKRHFEQVMRKVFSLNVQNRGVRVTEVYHIGDERNVSAAIKDEATARQIYISPLYYPPTHHNVEFSPGWVLRDALTKSVHTVEGILDIDKCITAKGEYQHPEPSMFEAPATPTIGVKGF